MKEVHSIRVPPYNACRSINCASLTVEGKYKFLIYMGLPIIKS